jgi:steroid 5-alpha reductase family enzyme
MTAAVLGATLAAALLAFTAFWAASLPRRDAGIVDFYWGPGFVVIGWLAAAIAGRFDAGSLLFLSLLTLWGVRLGWYMTARHGGAEDARYAAMRERHGEAFGRKSLWMVFWLQGVIQWIASSPALVVALSAAAAPGLPAWLGAAIFVLGFSIEIAADRAVARFKADPANRGRLLTTGLHGVVRHPNYIGEIILQWGLGIVAFAVSGNPLAFVGPALMHGLIVKLSGVPMLEEHFAGRPGYAEWKAGTAALWPRLKR